MARISVGSYEPAEVELWGHEFETVEVTKKLRKQLRLHSETIENTDDEDETIESIGAILNLRLVHADKQRTKPSTLLKQRWESEDEGISLARAMGILAAIGRADLPS